MSSKRHIRRKQCQGKVAYPTLESAQIAARISSRKFNTGLSPYKCHFCRGFHIGHLPAQMCKAMRLRRLAAFK
jgi:hypothetical protein